MREPWVNLNGKWKFAFDPSDVGEKEGWSRPGARELDREIVVPFPWESKLSGIGENYVGVGWYAREITLPDGDGWKGKNTWLVVGACDFTAKVWVNGQEAGEFTGGYLPFEVNLSSFAKPGGKAAIVIRAEDKTDLQQPLGKQHGWYTRTSGIWQTVYLEPRGSTFVAHLQSMADIKSASVKIVVSINGMDAGPRASSPEASFERGLVIGRGRTATHHLSGRVREPQLWSPDSPRLYPVHIELTDANGAVVDRVSSYFGLREVSITKAPGRDYQYIYLNGQPIYLRGALHQSFHPDGIYQYPDDATMRGDYELCKKIGINMLRIHIKTPIPRELYWADKLGVLIMQDIPNFWHHSDQARAWYEQLLEGAIARDFNHPAIFAWVNFNETWGLDSPGPYDADRQKWVTQVHEKTKKLDPTRLVEDNSPCKYDHTITDINSWHFYINDYERAKKHIAEVVEKTYPGSTFNYAKGYAQRNEPLMNSEYGGISAGLGDQDISWCFKYLTNELRKHDRVCGYIYTELSDIEWEHNGFVNYDRSEKEFGYDFWHPGMTLKDLNSPDFVVIDAPPMIELNPGETREVPIKISHWSGRRAEQLSLRWRTDWLDRFGERHSGEWKSQPATWQDYKVVDQPPIRLTCGGGAAAEQDAGAVLVPHAGRPGALLVELLDGEAIIARNYVNLLCKGPPAPRVEVLDAHRVAIRFRPSDLSTWEWPDQPVPPLSGIAADKVSARGYGSVEYQLRLPEGLDPNDLAEAQLLAVLSARAADQKLDWPVRKTAWDYPQTDARKWPSDVRIRINGQPIGELQTLPDDPADARGALSHLRQFQPGSWGYPVRVSMSGDAIQQALAGTRAIRRWAIRFEVPPDARNRGGLAVFGEGLGAWAIDPTLTLTFHSRHDLPADFTSDQSVTVHRIADRHQVVIATAEHGGHTWRYTTTDPGPEWAGIDCDDQAWSRGKGGFGRRETPHSIIGTSWKTADIWLRTEVNVEKPALVEAGFWRVFHDEDAEVYLNGVKVLSLSGHVTGYQDLPLGEGPASLREGRNVVAVHCRQTAGGQNIDLGLTLIRRQVD